MTNLSSLKGFKTLNRVQQQSINGGLYICNNGLQPSPCDSEEKDDWDIINE
ncbi:hypothetical protein [Aquimarina pacifica]|uniref:hypothetical protein n=1 Tax=Aquimarina pacifica TaxID=1296415 RepID=UPI0004B5CA2C|nr:hypothetical protein [Aquimarina pacifica]